MFDANDLVKAIKKAATEAVEAGKPAAFTHGKVVSSNPLIIEVDQKIQLGAKQLELGETIQEYEADIEIELDELEMELELEIEGEEASAHAKGDGKMKGKIKIRRSLDVGADVILVRQQGGQKYTVYDKVMKNGT